jgi:hypothetical protein
VNISCFEDPVPHETSSSARKGKGPCVPRHCAWRAHNDNVDPLFTPA